MYPDDDLMERRLKFLRENRPKEYRRLMKAGLLDAHPQAAADACVKEAERLIEMGTTFEAQVWQWAIRTELLESLQD